MLKSCKMQVRDGVLIYPEELKGPFLETGDLMLRDGTRVSPEEIWHFMTEEGPQKYPLYFTTSPNVQSTFPDYVELLSSIKIHYLDFSYRRRVESYRKTGMPLVWVQGGQLLDAYFAAGAIPARTREVQRMAADYLTEGLDERKRLFKESDLLEDGNRSVSIEACHMVIVHASIRKGTVPIDVMAPELCRRCSDCAYLVEAHRDSERKIPSFLVDYPENQSADKPWVVEYVAQSVRRLVGMLDEITGRKTTSDDFRAQIRLSNRLRKLARDCFDLWVSAEFLPAHSEYLTCFQWLGSHPCGDPVAAEQILREFYRELKERLEKSGKCIEICERPVRLFRAGGSCYGVSTRHLQRLGAVVVGRDDGLNLISVDVEEAGDPYENYAKAILSLPMERRTPQRARWTVEQARKARADGIMFGSQWGCNYTTAVAKLCCDVIQEAGIPVLMLDLDDLMRGESTEGTRTRTEAFVEALR